MLEAGCEKEGQSTFEMSPGPDVIEDLTMEYKISRCLYNITDVETMLSEQRGCREVPFTGMDKSGRAVCVKFTQGHCPLGGLCPLRHLVGDKQVVCKHWLRGLCKKGDQCEFLHEYDLSKMPECFFFSKYMACSNRECPFRHIDPDSKIKDCPWYDRGFCRHGPFCKHRHRRRVICPNYLCGFCPDGKECKFTHPSFNIPAFEPKSAANTRVNPSIQCHNCHERGPQGHELPASPVRRPPSSNRLQSGPLLPVGRPREAEHVRRHLLQVPSHLILISASPFDWSLEEGIRWSTRIGHEFVTDSPPAPTDPRRSIPAMSTSGKRGPKPRALKMAKEQKFELDSQPGPSTSTESLSEYCVPLSSLNPYITCLLCNGYFIDAITVMDCLHTFCKSCLLKYFEEHNDCPKCKVLIHQSHPTHYVSFDRTMQEIVYKLVPGLQAEELKRRNEFVEERRRLGLPTGDESEDEEDERPIKRAKKAAKHQRAAGGSQMGNGSAARNGVCGAKVDKNKAQVNGNAAKKGERHSRSSSDERRVEALLFGAPTSTTRIIATTWPKSSTWCPADDTSPILRPYIRLSVFATITTLKRTLAYTLRCGDISHYNDYDIFCNDELMGRDFSMMFIRKTRWRDHGMDEPLRLVYKLHKEF
ncbi:Cleavage and polyadenylation specificity factor subunit 4 [Aphelenchoides fujianensis]|nr:Cleavage and polyadenylation specificity factor subunit 4 [Aphelenchoides fujianensis]